MKSRRILPVAFVLALFLGACVTINVYFPGPAAQKAADRIIDNVWGQQAAPASDDEDNQNDTALRAPDFKRYLVRNISGLLIADAHAAADFHASSPAIHSIATSLKARFHQLRPFYVSGAIGLTHDGLVAVRDLGVVPLAQRTQLKKLVADDNADRKALYHQIAIANDHPEWEQKIRSTFATRWIEREHAGWYYQDANGGWHKK